MSDFIITEIDRVLDSDHHDPFQVLGMHFITEKPKAVLVRTFQPHAESVQIITGNPKSYLYKIRQAGLFEIVLHEYPEPFTYQLEAAYFDGTSHIFDDPYRFLPQLSDLDRYLFNSGTHYQLYNKLGAHLATIDDVEGTIFRVWAPAARRVSVIGDFNGWDGRVHQMRSLDKSGIWEIFIPGITENELYKFEIKTQYKSILTKSDPFQFYGELRPKTASIVSSLDNFSWHDQEWLEKRSATQPYDKPISIYELHLGSWQRDPADPERFLTYREIADRLIPYVKDLGFTHIELMPIMEHPLDESWGYQVTGNYSVTSRYGTPEEFMYFVDQCHQNDVGVILDWVPAHFPKDAHSLARFDGTALYEHEDPRQGTHPEWGTLVYNYGRKEVSNYLIANALFWFDKYHIDGLRVDAVASMLYLDYSRQEGEWLPNCYGGKENIEAIEFLKHLNSISYEHFPNAMMIAEESTSFFGVSKPADQGGLGFGFKWNMGWMNDTLSYISKDPLYRKYHHNALTFSLYYAFSENFILSISHDEVVHGKKSLIDKMPGDWWQQFANLRLLYTYMFAFPGKKLLFMGGEIAQGHEWNFDASIEWHLLDYEHHRGMQTLVGDLNRLYRHNTELHQFDFSADGFEWIESDGSNQSILSFLRKDGDKTFVIVLNFTPVPRHDYRVGLPAAGNYLELFNSDSSYYGGSNIGNSGRIIADDTPCHGRPHSLSLTLPPLGGVILKRQTH
ncbi:MAG: 1,4-alpha-glucan branching protein GlgB [Gammaproteobacteria bacterium]|nr:1,4-alpha-glucan branching protein GlgB [Gammaproteobacteria bacterium]